MPLVLQVAAPAAANTNMNQSLSFPRWMLLMASVSFCGLWAQVTVVNGAHFRREQPVAAGSLASAFGDFGAATDAAATALPLADSLGGFTLTVNPGNVRARLLFVSRTQVNFQVPQALAPGRYQIQVTNGSTTQSGNFIVMSAAPGIFQQGSGTGPLQGAILNQNNAANNQTSAAPRGQVIQIFATGPGGLSATIADGTAAPSNPVATTTSVPRVFVSGIPAVVQFSGLAPGFVGLWQVNVNIPNNVPPGRNLLQILQDGVDSQEVVVFVQ
jgi:uncharacterized protein (TIGR03437 family)